MIFVHETIDGIVELHSAELMLWQALESTETILPTKK
jgi:hypothetical protein